MQNTIDSIDSILSKKENLDDKENLDREGNLDDEEPVDITSLPEWMQNFYFMFDSFVNSVLKSI